MKTALYVQGGGAVKAICQYCIKNTGRGVYLQGRIRKEINNVTLNGVLALNHGWANDGYCRIKFSQSSNMNLR